MAGIKGRSGIYPRTEWHREIYRQQMLNHSWNKGLRTLPYKTCVTCGKKFYIKARAFLHLVHCSNECRKKQVKVICKWCGKEFSVKQYRLKHNVQFCSYKCREQGQLKICPICQKEFYVPKSWINIKRFCSVECKKRNYKHFYKNKEGYLVRLIDGRKKVYEHRLIMEKIIGRKLHHWEIVHHINGIKEDNKPKNLLITNRKEHPLLHLKREEINAYKS